MFAEDDIKRRKAEREAADLVYNDALTALDQAIPGIPGLPHPPVPYDEHQITPLNERWQTLGENPGGGLTGWRKWLAAFVWDIVRPALERQQLFNSTLVDHVNRNVVVHRANREAIDAILGALRAELEKLQVLHTKLILYLQTVTLYVDTKDRSEHTATLVHFMQSGLTALADEITRRWDSANAMSSEYQRRWEATLVREQRYVAAVDELRTSMATIQQTGLTLKRELERLLRSGVPATPAATGASFAPASSVSTPAAQASGQSAAVNDSVNAYKYVGFENKFRGSETDIRQRQLEYVSLFAGASDVLDLGCGRGEFLVLLEEHGVSARGLDINHEMVENCRARGLTVDEGDALTFLNSLPDGALGGLVALQVVEHFPPPYLLQFLDVAYQKLRPGAPIVLETLNPASWFSFFEAYIRDITHAWPLHPDTLKYLVLVSGFQSVDVRFSSPYPSHAKLQHSQVPPDAATLGMRNMVQMLNENVDKLNGLMFGYLDYAVVARKG